MALAAVDMENCNRKERCLSGPNAGLAYTPGSECDAGYVFNAATCDCDSTVNEGCMLYKVSYTVDSSGYSVCSGNASYDCNNVATFRREAIVACNYGAPYFKEVGEGSWDFGALTSFPGCGFAIASQGTYKILQLYADDANGSPQVVKSTSESPLQIYDSIYANKQSGGGCTVYDWDVYSDVQIEELCELNIPCISCGMDHNPVGTNCSSCPCPDGYERNSLCECEPIPMVPVYYIGDSTTPYQRAVFVGTSCDFIGPATGYGCKAIYAVIKISVSIQYCDWEFVQAGGEFCNSEGNSQPYPAEACPDVGVTSAFIPAGNYLICPNLPDENTIPDCDVCDYDANGNQIP